MEFQIHALKTEDFSNLFGLSDEELATHDARRMIADEDNAFPCRVTLRDAKIGETLLLTHYTHHDHNTPYRASHAVFVIENGEQISLAKNYVPDSLRRRLLSVRGFDCNHDLIEADVVDGIDIERGIDQLFINSNVEFIHVHNAKQGCYHARVERA